MKELIFILYWMGIAYSILFPTAVYLYNKRKQKRRENMKGVDNSLTLWLDKATESN